LKTNGLYLILSHVKPHLRGLFHPWNE